MIIDPALLREKVEALSRYNAWEKEHASGDQTMSLANRLAWLEEAYELAGRLGALRPLPVGEAAWREEVRGIQLMRERLAVLGARHG